MSIKDNDRLFIKSLAKGLSLLEVFSPQRPRYTLTELTGVTGMSLAAVQRCTHTLSQLGYLDRDEHKRYFLGSKVVSLAYSCLQGSELRRRAEEHLLEFSKRTGCTVNLAVLDDLDVLVLYRHEIRRFMKFDVQTGSKLPAYCTSMGKVLLAALDDRELDARIARMDLARITPHTITDRRELLRTVLEVRARGVSINDRELSLSLCSLSVPILNENAQVIAAANVAIFLGEGGEPSRTALLRELLDQGRKISALMGYQGEYPLITVQSGGRD